jgi:aminoglycoside 3-N-acetyltransferase
MNEIIQKRELYTKDSLISDLKYSGINPRGTLLIHSSCKSVGECENRGDTILDALIEYMRGGLLVFPTHTWDVIPQKNNVFDPVNTPSCVGILTNLFLKRDGVVRSLHPTHSVAALGEDAVDFIKGEEFTRSPCSRSGCYGKLYDRGAQILFLGCDLTKNTFLHGVEEWNNIPDRLTAEPLELYIKSGDELIPCPLHGHQFRGGDISLNYIKAEKIFIERGAVVYCRIGSAHCVLCDAVKMADIIGECLKESPDLFSNE